jgi:hypothetical protein
LKSEGGAKVAQGVACATALPPCHLKVVAGGDASHVAFEGDATFGRKANGRSKTGLRHHGGSHIARTAVRLQEVFFDGWYLYRKHAEEIFELFKKRYPHANVFIVKQLKTEWRGKQNARLETHRATCAATGT